MYLKCHRRRKDGKEHRYWSIVESVRTRRGVMKRPLLYLGELNDSQKAQWCSALDVLDESTDSVRQISLFPEDRTPPPEVSHPVRIRLSRLSLHHPRQWGGCWLAMELWNELDLDRFWSPRLPASRKGTGWLHVLKTLVTYRLLDPGSEWRLHRDWFKASAMADLLGEDESIAAKNTLYRCLDKLGEHKADLFSFLKTQWRLLFDASYEVLLYDLTSTYFECDVPEREGLRKFGYSRDKRSDCVQVVIALIVTPEGFPVAYEVMPGNTSDKTTLPDFLRRIEAQYGKMNRLWIMDRGIPTEDALEQMRAEGASYLVGTPRGRLSKLEDQLFGQPWRQVQEQIEVKLARDGEDLYVLTRSGSRCDKERSMRQRKLKKLWKRLHQLGGMKNLKRDELLLKLGAAKQEAGKAWGLVDLRLPQPREAVTPESFHFRLNRKKLRKARRGEGTYLLRTNLAAEQPEELWKQYMVLNEVEQAFKELKNDLDIRPVYHQKDERIEAHIFVSFLSYALQVTLKQRAKARAPGLTPRAILEKFKAVQMIDVHLPTTDGRTLILPRYTQPEKDLQLLLHQLNLTLPEQPPPRLEELKKKCGADL
ncbi:IS1634 family transposase [Kiritimatiella glycovorans]|uniref:Transposase n=1 Tax=Kiritimatiella glycovorans TaxID=1307763 RepID=A0A0G3EBS8_9BACT|nr:IS1634 family transposase [Kiritimatiella glycovorans]AKJ63709.1 Transposase [Kiritimatiella glycovorans]AKJ63911.1 Transposase [Kiritimatiella glycovorans]AKJ65165.1 Transposase [Kiritimatiella glycovorans]AKJ65169.1 Transposase [Kiritimatiella glycovorans]